MKNKTSNHKLMSTLKVLYGKVSVLINQMRRQSYHSLFSTKNTFDMTTVLNNQIDEYAAQQKKDNAEDINKTNNETVSSMAHMQHKTEAVRSNTRETQNSVESEFTKHLKMRKSSSVTQPHMGDTLKASAWEHIHSAIRFAKQGELDKAKLHTSIAGRALEEAGHYMNDQDYRDLVCQVEHYFTDAKK